MWTGPRPSPSRNALDRSLRHHHRVAVARVADAEAGELENVAVEVLGEVRENAAVVAPAGDTGTRSVQQHQRRTVAGLVIAEHTEIGLQLFQSVPRSSVQSSYPERCHHRR